MPVFYDYIKGCAEIKENETPLLTYITFTNGKTPIIKIDQKDTSEKESLGSILTDKVEGQNILSPVLNSPTIKNKITYGNGDSNDCHFEIISGNQQIELKTNYKFDLSKATSFKLPGFEALIDKNTQKEQITITTNDFSAKKMTVTEDVAAKNITATDAVKGTRFVASSDIRVKDNVRKSEFNALNIINTLPIYNFNYKATNLPSIGIIAQEAEKIAIDDFKIVDNTDPELLTVNESKLVYILWKAIQEQQQEIDSLKLQLSEVNK